jgi:hypothetical protein
MQDTEHAPIAGLSPPKLVKNSSFNIVARCDGLKQANIDVGVHRWVVEVG